MFFKLNTNSLRNALTKILSVVEKKSTQPILSYALIEVESNYLILSATDTEIHAQVKVPIQSTENISFCVNAKNLFDILKELPDSELSLKLENNSNIVNLINGDIHYSLLIYSANDFPRLKPKQNKYNLTLKSDELLNMISKTSHAISNDETRMYLNGIFFQEIDLKLRAVATDGHRLSLSEMNVDNNSIDTLVNGIIVPKKGVAELKRMAESFIDGEIKLTVDESFIYASTLDEYFLSIRLIARDYPKYQAVIPSKTSFKITTDRDSLFDAVKRIKIMSNEKSNQIRVNIKEKELTLMANHPSLGKAKEKIDITYSGKEMEIGFNAKYLIDTLSTLNEGDISIELNNELSPVIIKSQSLPNFLGIIMPLKL